MKKTFIAFISVLLFAGPSGCSSNTSQESVLDPSEVEKILLENDYEINIDLLDLDDDSIAWVEASGKYLFYYTENCSSDGNNRRDSMLSIQDFYIYSDVELFVSEDANTRDYTLYHDDGNGCRIDYVTEEPLDEDCEYSSELYLQDYKESLDSYLEEIGLDIDSIYNYLHWYLDEKIEDEVLENEYYSQKSENNDSSENDNSESDASYFPTTGESNALETAQNYLDTMPFSEQGLSDQLESEGYSDSEISYAIKNCGADWNEQAAIAAQSYLDLMSFSRQELIDQLLYEGFTEEQAEYGVTAVGY